MSIITCLIIGLSVGVLSGILGLGGGIFLIPALVYFFKMTQQQAQGTSLAIMIPPVGILAAMTYYKQGHIDIKIAALIALGFVLGGYVGAKLGVNLPNIMLRKIFGVTMLLISLKMIFGK